MALSAARRSLLLLRPRCLASLSLPRALCTEPPPLAEPTHFGYQTVDASAKAGLVAGVFAAVAPRYDLMNDLMSGGLHRVWKDRLVASLRPAPGAVHLDVAGGTGDVAFRVLDAMRRAERAQRVSPGAASSPPPQPGTVLVSDINPSMLEEGRKRADAAGLRSAAAPLDERFHVTRGADVAWLEADAESLPLADSSVDAYTIAFGLRNVTRPDAALCEAFRVLRTGGRLLVLEFSTVRSEALRSVYDAASFALIPRLGQAVTGDGAPYQYLVESIRQWAPQEELEDMMRAAGFSRVTHEDWTGGVVALHSGFKF